MPRSLNDFLCICFALCICLSTACGAQAARIAVKSPSPSAAAASPSAAPSSTPIAEPSSHVFVIVMENRSYSQVISAPYISSLASKYAVATNYHGVSHPSLPNYLAMTSGSTWGIADDGYHRLPLTGLGSQLTAAKIPWRAYMEGMTGNCLRSPYPYALKHDPFPYFGGACPKEVAPFTQFAADIKSADMPRFVWITPGLCNDGHDCSTAVADRWLSQVVPEILGTPAWQQNGLLIITWDEGDDAANQVLTLAIRPGGHVTSDHYYNHYSLLATIEDRLGLSRLGEAAKATAMTDLVLIGEGVHQGRS